MTQTHDAETVERVAKAICKDDPIEAFNEDARWALAEDRYAAMARAALSAMPPQEVSVADASITAADVEAAALDENERLRAALYQIDQSSGCPCADMAREALKIGATPMTITLCCQCDTPITGGVYSSHDNKPCHLNCDPNMPDYRERALRSRVKKAEAERDEAHVAGYAQGVRDAAKIAAEADDNYLAEKGILALLDADAPAPSDYVTDAMHYGIGVQRDGEHIPIKDFFKEPTPMHEDAPRAIIGEIGNQIHNLGCEYQHDEDLSAALADLASRIWEAAKMVSPDAPAQPKPDAVQPDWEGFSRDMLDEWPVRDVEGSELFDAALRRGLIREIPGGYDPENHIDAEGICPETGDPWYEYAFPHKRKGDSHE